MRSLLKNVTEYQKPLLVHSLSVAAGHAMSRTPLMRALESRPENRQLSSILLCGYMIEVAKYFGAVEGDETKARVVSAWLPPGRHYLTRRKQNALGFSELQRRLSRETIGRFGVFTDFLSRFRHTNGWYLSLLAVSPDYQGRGFARSNMERMLGRIDCAASACCLDTQSPQNIGFYGRFGFSVIESRQHTGLGLENRRLYRPPRLYPSVYVMG